MGAYERPEGGWRAHFQGVKVNTPPDALQPTKSPYSQNIRAYRDQTVATRPGYTLKYTGGNQVVTDIRAYTTLGTDSLPRLLSRNSNNQIYLDNGALVATLAGPSQGAFMIPFRPNQSPQAYMYIASQGDYQKLSAPDSNNNVVVQKVGIAEPQTAVEACPDGLQFNDFTALAASWAQGGTAGAVTDSTRTTDTATAIFADPASVSPTTKTRYSVQVSDVKSYSIGETLSFTKSTGGTIVSEIEDVYPPIGTGASLTIQSIYYFTGTTGRCIIVPSQLQVGSNNQQSLPTLPFLPGQLAGIRRGSLIQLNAEVCFVLSVTTGPQGSLSVEVSTTGTHAIAETIIGIPAICVSGISNLVVGQTVTSAQVNSAVTTGVGTITQTLGTNPFNLGLGTIGTPQETDYIHVSMAVDVPSNVLELKILFNIDSTDTSFTHNVLYFSISPSSLTAALANTQTQLSATQVFVNNVGIANGVQTSSATGSTFAGIEAAAAANQAISTGTLPTDLPNIPPEGSEGGRTPEQLIADVSTTSPMSPGVAATGSAQFTEVLFPISALQRIGNDQTQTLTECVAVQILVNCTGNVNFSFGSIWVGGGRQPDVSSGTPYLYIVRPRSSLTGAIGNPSPLMRYGVTPVRQRVILSLPSAAYDTQIDTWDIFRYGGTVPAYRYIGSSKIGVTFSDNVLDTSAIAGSAIDYTNFEPWPSIDTPWNAILNSGGITSMTATGTAVIVLGSTFPSTIANWLPGNAIVLDGQCTYTLWARPIAISGGYLFRLVESSGNPVVTTASILEPSIANQRLPYLWGPDVNGVIYGCGDPLRPGTFYFSKSNTPDSAPDTNNQELTSPSEPLLGGIVINGISLIASSDRWWKLYINYLSNGVAYQAVEMPVGRGLAAPYAHCSDGKSAYFVAKDGVWMTAGGSGISLTDRDLYTLFPHDDIDIPVNYTYGGYTIYAPDYTFASDFRLAFNNSYLYFDYRDSSGFARTLVCDLRDPENPAWAPDVYNDSITTHYSVEQPESTLLTTTQKYALLITGDAVGKVYQGALNANDNGVPISGVYSTFEYNGGDLRETQLFNDAFIDMVPVSSALAAPLTNGIAQVAAVVIPSSTSRVQTNIPVGLELKYMGVLIAWTDNFNIQSAPTSINAWQPMYQGVPVSVYQWKTQKSAFGLLGYKHLRQWNFAYRSTAPVNITVTAYDGTSPAVITLPSTSGQVQKTIFPFTFNKGMLYDVVGLSSQPWTPYNSESELYVGSWDRQGLYKVAVDWEAPVGLRS